MIPSRATGVDGSSLTTTEQRAYPPLIAKEKHGRLTLLLPFGRKGIRKKDEFEDECFYLFEDARKRNGHRRL